jgi:U-box domain/Armadillo/beta-catenin-like repeat
MLCAWCTLLQACAEEACLKFTYKFYLSSHKCFSYVGCPQKLEKVKCNHITSSIKEASKQVESKANPQPEALAAISASLNLSTNLELFMEAVALEKLKSTSDFDQIAPVISLIEQMHETLIKSTQPHSISGVPIPADFCCPLSLNLMSDPVIVSSGQTYERVFIRKWLDLGYTVCPKTRSTLAHTNLIPNYTVKQLIANWCESNDIELADPNKLLTQNFPQILMSPSFDSNPKLNSPKSENNNNSKILPVKGAESISSGLSISTHEDNGPTVQSSSSNAANLEQGSGVNSVSRVSTDSDASSEASQERATQTATPPVQTEQGSSMAAGTTTASTRGHIMWPRPSDRLVPRIVPSPSAESRPDLVELENEVRKLIEDLKSDSTEIQRAAAMELRFLAKHNMENRIVIASCGVIAPLVGLLHSNDSRTQEHAVTALLNLSINDNNKIAIANAEAIDPLIHVLQTGSSEAKENSAATLFSLSVIEENKVRIGRSGAIAPLVELLGNGTPRGRKDAATALFNLSIFHENKTRIVQAGAVKHLVDLMDPAAGMVDKAVAVLANLATIPEGRNAIGQNDGIPLLVEVVELGSLRGKENAAAALLHLCTNSNRFCSQVLQEGAVPPLVALSQSGTPRAKEKVRVVDSFYFWHSY